ncbi:MAG: DUF3127 domain-containing protein [Bacteroides sp.]|jgi:hypothetical protein|nr:DUF3127 domain-containing protein [Bacteroides sp.]
MEITGKVVEILTEQSGQGRNGIWRRQEFILEVPGQYPRKVCIALWGDKIDQVALKTGEEVTASIDIESREYNGKWFTSVKAWKVDKVQAATGSNEAPDFPPPGEPPLEPYEGQDDLPF